MQRGAVTKKSHEDAESAYKVLDAGNQQSSAKESRRKRLGPLKTAASSLAARLHMTEGRKRTHSRQSGKVVTSAPATPTTADSKSSNESDDADATTPREVPRDVELSKTTPERQVREEEPSAAQLAPGWIMGPREPTEEEKAAIEEEKKRRTSFDQALARLGHTSPPKPVLAAGPFAAAQESSIHLSPDRAFDGPLASKAAIDAIIVPAVPAGPFAAAQEASVLLPPTVFDVQERSSARISMERAVEHQEVLVERLANLVSREESDKPDALKRMDNASDARDYVKKGPLGALKSTSLPGVLPSTCTEGAGNLAAVNYRQRTETRNAPGSSHITLVGDEAAQRPAPSSLFDTMPQNIVVPDSVVESVIANLQFVRMTRGLNWIINRPILSCSIVVLVWATLRGIWSLLPGEVQEFRPALLLSGIVALAATLLAYYVGGATLMPETEREPILDEAEGPSTPVMGESADPTLTLPTDPYPDVVGTVQGDDKQDKEQQNLDVSPIVETTMEALDPGMEMVGAVHQEGPPAGGLDGRYQESMEQPTKGQNQKKEEGYSTDSDRPGPVLEGVHPIDK